MPEIYRTTAEHVIGATDAALQTPGGVNEALVEVFLDTVTDNARNALLMAEQLGLLRQDPPGNFVINSPCATYLCTSGRENKAAILRYVLEQYIPYRTFKERLSLTGVVGEAANQTRAIHALHAHRDLIVDTFTNLGTYGHSLISEGAGLYKPAENNPHGYLSVLDQAIQDRETARLAIRRRMGAEAAGWIDQAQVMENLITAYQRCGTVEDDPSAPILHAGNAVESFLVQLAAHYGVNLQGAMGINSKADRIAAGPANHLTSKHKSQIKYLGNVRNAADHGVDLEVGVQWEDLTDYISRICPRLDYGNEQHSRKSAPWECNHLTETIPAGITALEITPVESPITAVRASIMADSKKGKQ